MIQEPFQQMNMNRWPYKRGMESQYDSQDTIKDVFSSNSDFKLRSNTFPKNNSPLKNVKKNHSKPEPKKYLKKGQGKAAWSCTARNLGLNVSNNDITPPSSKPRPIRSLPKSNKSSPDILEPRDPNPDGCIETSIAESHDESKALREFEYLEQAANDTSNLENIVFDKKSRQEQDCSAESDTLVSNNNLSEVQILIENTNNSALETSTPRARSGSRNSRETFFQEPTISISRKVARFKPKIQVQKEPPPFRNTPLNQALAEPVQIAEPDVEESSPSKSDSYAQAQLVSFMPDSEESTESRQLPQVMTQPSTNGPALVLTDNLKAWIDKLEVEITNYQDKTLLLSKLKTDLEKKTADFEAEKKRFNQSLQAEKSSFEDYRESELRKLKKERKVLDDYSKAIKTYPTKSEREQIESLKMELNCAKQEFELKESRFNNQLNSARSRVNNLESDNKQLHERIVSLEAELVRVKATAASRSKASVSAVGDVRSRSQQQVNNIDAVNAELSERFRTSSTQSLHQSAHETEAESSRTPATVHLRASSTSREQPSASSSIAIHTSRSPVNITMPASTVTCPKRSSSQDLTARTILSLPPPVCTQNQDIYAAKALSVKTEFAHLYEWPEPNSFPRDVISYSNHNNDGSLETFYRNGLVVVKFANGSVKELYPDKKTSVVSLFNGDVKRTFADGRVVYKYAADGSVQTTYPDGVDEMRYADGKVEVICSPSKQQTVSHELPTVLPTTSTSWSQALDGDKFKEIRRPNGEIEIHCPSFKRRIYPDGNVKTVYANGTHETRYASGRIRIKDSVGNLIVDTFNSNNNNCLNAD